MHASENCPFEKSIEFVDIDKSAILKSIFIYIAVLGLLLFFISNFTIFEITLVGMNSDDFIKLFIITVIFSADSVLMVLASELYDENDYIRDYDEFLKFIQQ